MIQNRKFDDYNKENYDYAFMGVNYVLSSGSQFVIFNSSTIISQFHNQVHTCGHSQIVKQTQTGMKKNWIELKKRSRFVSFSRIIA